MNKDTKLSREEWLQKMMIHLKSKFEENGYYFKRKIKVSCGIPVVGNSLKTKDSRVVGSCYPSDASLEYANEIFITPEKSDSMHVAGILCHEMIHAWDDCKNGHRKQFSTCARMVGLMGPPTSAEPGYDLRSFINEKIKEIGEYPHKELIINMKKKQPTRLLKVVCPNNDCYFSILYAKPYIVRMSSTTLDFASPKCGACDTKMVTNQKLNRKL